ncbi:venom protease-like [Periplaneta americana]|uniref:venom protease-like n=1 Tax=Periplaneta americana TaxID=6978 RepID=UPI0037E89D91
MDKCLYLLFALSFLQLAFAQKKEGEACTSGQGSAGVCRKVSSCPSAQQDVENMRLPMSAICTFDERDPVVCCPNSNGGGSMKLVCEQDASRNRRRLQFYNIVGGVRAKKREFPHMAAVGFLRGSRTLWLCGGSLIHRRFVLTAAHCLEDTSFNRAGKPRFVRLGDLDLKSDEDDVDAKMYDIVKRIPHPEYKQSKQYHDIALLKLGQDVVFNSFMKPACLHTEHNIASPDVIATGWGRGAPVNETGKKLMAVTLQQQPMAKCQEALKMVNAQVLKNALHEGLKEDSMMCAGVDEGGKDTCGGDSGGPIQVKVNSRQCDYAVVGLVSFGIGLDCARPGVPAVYTRVSSYVSWIEREVC